MQAIRLQQTIEKDGEIHLSDLKVIAKSIDALNLLSSYGFWNI